MRILPHVSNCLESEALNPSVRICEKCFDLCNVFYGGIIGIDSHCRRGSPDAANRLAAKDHACAGMEFLRRMRM